MADVPIHFECSQKLPAVQVDAVQIQQVALNLIRNAIEAVARTESRADGVVVQTDSEEGWVCFRVSDRGPGLSPDIEKNLFHPFFSTKAGGMGVGLSICQNIVQAHGGEIGYRKNQTGGATFYCRLPPAE
jgi:two-component system, LuxR family, sensor kinase FixL